MSTPQDATTAPPWKARIWSYSMADPPYKQLIIESRTNRLAVVDVDWEEDNPYVVAKAEAMAVGVKMAAAPELLAALEEILDLEPDDAGDRIIYAGFLDNAREAIAKATSTDPIPTN
jgi:hypothetical protein